MHVTRTMKLCALSFAVTAGIAGADTFRPVRLETDRNWTNINLWFSTNRPGEKVFPGDADETRISGGAVRITTPVTVGYLKVGSEGSGTVIIDGGTLVTVGTSDYNSASFNAPGTLIVTNGGSAVFNSRFMVGFKNYGGGRVEIYDGTVRVARSYFHNKDYTGSEPINTRTTVHQGGVLEVNELILNSGVINIAGGTVMIRKGYVEQITHWIAEGRIIAMGGAAGWKIKVTVDPSTGHIVLTAELSGESFSVGMRSPVPSCFGKKG